MPRWQIKPMERWPWPETTVRRGNPFRSTLDKTLAKLVDEFDRLDGEGLIAVHVVTESPDDVRQDGMLRAKARVAYPGVAVSFISRLGEMTYPCDAFENRYAGQPDWQVNLRAITLGLEALRMLDRYGMAGKQYAGYLALPAGGDVQADDSLNTAAGAERFLRSLVGEQLRTASLKAVWRSASVRHHPDSNGGEDGLWNAVQRAGQTLHLTVGATS
jgi:hypothetical protein